MRGVPSLSALRELAAAFLRVGTPDGEAIVGHFSKQEITHTRVTIKNGKVARVRISREASSVVNREIGR